MLVVGVAYGRREGRQEDFGPCGRDSLAFDTTRQTNDASEC